MANFPGRGNDQRLWAIDSHHNRQLDMIYAKEKKILQEMDAVMQQAKQESKGFKKMVEAKKERTTPSGRDVKANKISERLAEVKTGGWDGVSAKPSNMAKAEKDWDKKMREDFANSNATKPTTCSHCNRRDARPGSEWCSFVCQSAAEKASLENNSRDVRYVLTKDGMRERKNVNYRDRTRDGKTLTTENYQQAHPKWEDAKFGIGRK